jgi:hypothetical protein
MRFTLLAFVTLTSKMFGKVKVEVSCVSRLFLLNVEVV